MTDFKSWINRNSSILEELYYKLIEISHNNGIQLIDNKNSFQEFLLMMFNESYI
jgi:hypothetical protein